MVSRNSSFVYAHDQWRSNVGAGPCARIPEGPLSSPHRVRLGLRALNALHTLLLATAHDSKHLKMSLGLNSLLSNGKPYTRYCKIKNSISVSQFGEEA